MALVNIQVAKTHLSRLVDRAAAGEEIVIAKSGRPVAKLVPIGEANLEPRALGALRGVIEVPDNLNEPLPPEVIDAFYGVDPADTVDLSSEAQQRIADDAPSAP
jgi:prevent-host-death family protein